MNKQRRGRVSAKISHLMHEGKRQDVAVATAINMEKAHRLGPGGTYQRKHSLDASGTYTKKKPRR